jgi:hypothetical protein
MEPSRDELIKFILRNDPSYKKEELELLSLTALVIMKIRIELSMRNI